MASRAWLKFKRRECPLRPRADFFKGGLRSPLRMFGILKEVLSGEQFELAGFFNVQKNTGDLARAQLLFMNSRKRRIQAIHVSRSM
jgi:hypothetical protein